MRYLLLTLTVLIFVSCREMQPARTSSTAISASPMSSITVKGRAENAKAGAYLLGPDAGYYVEGLTAWPDSLLGKQVEVTGTLKVVEHRKEDLQNDRGEYSQGMVGEQRLLQQATWRLAD